MFQGFPEDGLRFLSELNQNNSKEWFSVNKSRFKTSLEQPAKLLVTQLEDALNSEAGKNTKPWRGKVFRFYRDLRFSKDKTPYNTHLRIGWNKEDQAGLFLSLEEGHFTVGGGTFDFGRQGLERYRETVASKKGERLSQILHELCAKGYRLEAPELKRVPRGYDKDHTRAELLKRKSLTVWWDSSLTPEVHDERFSELLLDKIKELDELRIWIGEILSWPMMRV